MDIGWPRSPMIVVSVVVRGDPSLGFGAWLTPRIFSLDGQPDYHIPRCTPGFH